VFVASVALAGLASAAYAALIYWIDHYEKEPWWLLAAMFVWGAVPGVFLALVYNTVFGLPVFLWAGGEGGDALVAQYVAPLVEESVKGVVLLAIFAFWRHEIDSPLDGIIYGAMVGLGFGLTEDVLYLMAAYGEDGLGAWVVVLALRSIAFGLSHSLYAGLTGLGVAIARLTSRPAVRLGAPVLGWAAAVFLHHVHNAGATGGSILTALAGDWAGIGITALIIVWALAQERSWIRLHLADEVAAGTLTAAQYDATYRIPRRAAHHLSTLFSRGPSAFARTVGFYHRCSTLAYKKHHFSRFGDDRSRREIERLRSEIAALSGTPV